MKEASIALNLYEIMLSKEIIYVFLGKFHYSTINFLLTDLKGMLSRNKEELNTSRKTYRVVVECLENAYKHSVKSSSEIDGILTISRIEKGYNVQIGNIIKKEELEELKKRIDLINSKSLEELKTFYKTSIMQSEVSDKGGAGVGIIDMAIKSSNMINYYHNKQNENSYFFALEINITDGKI